MSAVLKPPPVPKPWHPQALRLRREQGLDCEAISVLVGVSQSTVWRFLSPYINTRSVAKQLAAARRRYATNPEYRKAKLAKNRARANSPEGKAAKQLRDRGRKRSGAKVAKAQQHPRLIPVRPDLSGL